jgi:hypothetical protein
LVLVENREQADEAEGVPMQKMARKKLAKKTAAPKVPKTKTKVGGEKSSGRKKAGAHNRQAQWINQSADTVALVLEELEARSGEQSGDLQGLSNVECADSESVDELLEEGNAFEAEVVKGVEDAEDAEEVEVRTHAAPQNDVPGEYRNRK